MGSDDGGAAYIEQLGRERNQMQSQNDTIKAQRAHDKLKIDGLEKRIARLRAENERLRERLHATAGQLEAYLTTYSPPPDKWDAEGWCTLRAAQAALEQTEGAE